MIFEGNTLREFQEKYGIREIETRLEPIEFFDGKLSTSRQFYNDTEVRLTMYEAGFRQMMRDLSKTPGTDVGERYFRTTFEVDKLCLQDDIPWVAKFDASHQDLAVIKVLADKLAKEFPDKTIIFLPKDINIEAMGIDGLTALRDHLSSIIENLNYDNIMGF